ncbi:MAG TPA: accessory factor UbiK family protein [Acidiferrobacteraceae bacterium]|nr:accessory factor UbiK family protein [Acidiferrobacteraceae bacterium]
MKLPPSSIDQVTAALADALPSGLGDDLRHNARGVVRSAFEHLDLVTREEFEVQEAVLRRTREKIEQLENQVRTLEAELLKK